MLDGEELEKYLFVTIMSKKKKNTNMFHNFTLDD